MSDIIPEIDQILVFWIDPVLTLNPWDKVIDPKLIKQPTCLLCSPPYPDLIIPPEPTSLLENFYEIEPMKTNKLLPWSDSFVCAMVTTKIICAKTSSVYCAEIHQYDIITNPT